MDTGSASCSVQGPGRAVSCATSRSSLICTCAPCVGVVSPPVARVCRASRCICWGWDAFSRASPSSVSVACARVPERPACTARSCTAVEPPPSSLPGGSDRSSSGVESLTCSSKVALSGGSLQLPGRCLPATFPSRVQLRGAFGGGALQGFLQTGAHLRQAGQPALGLFHVGPLHLQGAAGLGG